jgi:hypothetical protein
MKCEGLRKKKLYNYMINDKGLRIKDKLKHSIKTSSDYVDTKNVKEIFYCLSGKKPQEKRHILFATCSNLDNYLSDKEKQ